MKRVVLMSVLLAVGLLWGVSYASLATAETSSSDSVNPEARSDSLERGRTNPEAPEAPEADGRGEPAVVPVGEDQRHELGPGEPGEGEPEAQEPSQQARPAAVRLEVDCSGEGVCREALTGLPLRILPRPFSNIYSAREASKQHLVEANVKAFAPLYVFAREGLDISDPANPQGWYRVGRAVLGAPAGWMQARDVLEWKQALIVAYTHPGTGDEARQRVLMFDTLADLRGVVESQVRAEMATLLYDRIERGQVPEGIVSKEPERFVHINRDFYLLPIVDYQTIDLEGDLARYLQIAAAVPQQRGADTLADPEYREQAQRESRLSGEAAEALGVDIVFVMDTTRSMQPYIDRTKHAVAGLARGIAEEEAVSGRVRFGLVGYRDDADKIPALQYTVRDFTPELLDVEAFAKLLETEVKATRIGSVDYAEEVFAGIRTALDAQWRDNALRLLVLVGDASSHPVGHEQNTTGLDAERLRLAADDQQVHIVAIHLLDPRVPGDHAVAREQYSVLARVRGSQQAALAEVDTDAADSFQQAVQRINARVTEVVAHAQAGSLSVDAVGGDRQTDGDAGIEDDAVDQADRAAQAVLRAALVEYLGREADPPKDILAWVLDRDLTSAATRALEVRVLVSKEQLSDLIRAVERVTQAMTRAETTQMAFFEALQSISGQAMKNPEAIGQAQVLAESGLLPSFIESLPYRSEVLSLSDAMYASMTAEQRAALGRGLQAKLQQYRAINEDVDAWVRLHEGAPQGERVYPLHLESLP